MEASLFFASLYYLRLAFNKASVAQVEKLVSGGHRRPSG